MLVDKDVENVIRSLVGAKVVTYVNEGMDSEGIEKFTIEDCEYYLNEIEDENLEFNAVQYCNDGNHFRLFLSYKL